MSYSSVLAEIDTLLACPAPCACHRLGAGRGEAREVTDVSMRLPVNVSITDILDQVQAYFGPRVSQACELVETAWGQSQDSLDRIASALERLADSYEAREPIILSGPPSHVRLVERQ